MIVLSLALSSTSPGSLCKQQLRLAFYPVLIIDCLYQLVCFLGPCQLPYLSTCIIVYDSLNVWIVQLDVYFR